jgi:deoxyribose-phosphate aldolase
MSVGLANEVDRIGRGLDAARVPRASAASTTPRWAPRDSSLAARIDHTLLRPDATDSDVLRLCDEALEYRFAAACVAPVFVATCARRLAGSGVRVASVCGFPHGNHTAEVKALEAARAVNEGADEIDVVLHIGALKAAAYRDIWLELSGVVAAAGGGCLVKVILETTLLTDDEKIAGCLLAERAGAHFVKTSTGFAAGGATVEDVRLLRAVVGDRLGVKASGGIRTRAEAETMIAAGADRLGCSASVRIVA